MQFCHVANQGCHTYDDIHFDYLVLNVKFSKVLTIYGTELKLAGCQYFTQRAHDIKITSYLRRCDVMTSHRR